jgi:hypothetical protein
MRDELMRMIPLHHESHLTLGVGDDRTIPLSAMN